MITTKWNIIIITQEDKTRDVQEECNNIYENMLCDDVLNTIALPDD